MVLLTLDWVLLVLTGEELAEVRGAVVSASAAELVAWADKGPNSVGRHHSPDVGQSPCLRNMVVAARIMLLMESEVVARP